MSDIAHLLPFFLGADVEAGTPITAVEMLAAQKLRSQFVMYLTDDLHDWDALVLPTLPVPAPVGSGSGAAP